MMKFKIERVSSIEYRLGGYDFEGNKVEPTYKEFNTVEELCKFVDEIGEDVIIRRCLDGSKKLLIYDDYIE